MRLIPVSLFRYCRNHHKPMKDKSYYAQFYIVTEPVYLEQNIQFSECKLIVRKNNAYIYLEIRINI